MSDSVFQDLAIKKIIKGTLSCKFQFFHLYYENLTIFVNIPFLYVLFSKYLKIYTCILYICAYEPQMGVYFIMNIQTRSVKSLKSLKNKNFTFY